MSLREYARKRKFGQTPEPAAGGRRHARRPIFVVQLHHARARHYDFRLEVDGALKSWAVPKGPSLRPGEQRLAVEVEDHPIAYAGFAGDIPAGHYGAGHVDIFDHGTWQPETDDPLAAIAAGKLDFELHGERLRGRWTLVRTRRQGGRNQWLLLKRSDAEARDAEADDLLDAPMRKATAAWRRAHGQGGGAAAKRASAKPAAEKPAKKPAAPTRRKAPARSKAEAAIRTRALALPGARDEPLPAGFRAQLATLRAHPPAGQQWLHETKWDGYRLLADLDDGKVRLRSRNDLDWTARLPQVAAALEALPVGSARLDGELVALDAHGGSSFAELQQALKDGRTQRLRYVLFDLPGVAGVDLTRVPLDRRKALLEQVLEGAGEALAYSTHVEGHGAEVFAAAGRRGLEGIVSKRADAGYAAGRRTPDWVKVKHSHSDEFAIVGYTPPQGSRQGFGSLLMAERERGGLRYVGRVGTGFDAAALRELTARLKKLAVAGPVVEIPAHVPLPARRITWVRPQLVAEVAFRGWGGHRLLRQASFLRLREDKNVDDLDLQDAGPAPRKRAAAARHTGAGNMAKKPEAAGSAAGEGVTITHASRVVYPDSGIRKGDVAAYYTAVARWILPGLADRPLSLLRCPGGIGGECFFQKHHAASLGDSVRAVALKEKDAGTADYVYVRDLRGLLELVQMNTLEFHPWGARVDRPDAPDRIVFDLDPAEGVAWKAVVAAAREIRARLDEIGLQSFVRTSGGKGLHVVVPFRRGPDWDTVKRFCESFADAMVALHPLRYVATASKAQRKGRIFIDWLRNARGATSVCNWSLRARAGAPVAMPLRWGELGRVKGGGAFDMKKALRRAARLDADPWEGIDAVRQRLPKL
ncbi:DNA ligase [Frateuria sp. Soil773]|uniref:DNA ligase D n=1 Tax=Frateuria sp. Soil773 TaxID=1736407 RepID=UPI0006F867BD|nr:DNA ligase D [Frateuria sp. Soil773]KRE88735.1 DNA ligase [Frateuria sp. Soil773]